MSEIILECKGLTKIYGKTIALDYLDLTLERGRIVGLLGPNGSGKSTLIKIAAGLLTPDSGSVLIDGLAPGTKTKAKISYLPDRDSLSGQMRICDAMEMFKDFYADFDPAKADEMTARLGLEPKARIKSLSKGNREKLQLILTMSRAAELYLLDEPVGGVDPATRDYIINTIITNYSENATVLISTHLISDVENILDEAVFLSRGRVALRGGADSLREEKGMSIDALFREVFKC